jgi:hypothetical protein
VDFPKSEFYRKEYGYPTNDKFALKTYSEFLYKSKEFGSMSMILAKKLVLSSPFNNKFDIFTIPEIDYSIYVSEKLAESLTMNNISGIELQEATNIIS